MRKLAFVLAATMVLGFTASASAASAVHDVPSDTQTTDMSAQRVVRRTVVRRAPGWRRFARPSARRVVTVRRPNGTTVRRVFRNGRMVREVIRR